MAYLPETTFGASVVQPISTSTPPKSHLNLSIVDSPQHPRSSDVETSHSRATTPNELIDSKSSSKNPFSAFYAHGDARRSLDESRNPSKSHLDVDVEAASAPISAVSTQVPKASVDGRVKECTVWPSKAALEEKERRRKKERMWWDPMRNLNKRQKLWVKILIALFIVAAAVGIGIGISRAVGGGVWAGKGETHAIPDS
ncbi:hypothetical protein M501DRAFT_993383 [Patellaria atrata CBS 101060]|uniref:Uncharacterized protein n=1 Tax=Patellaria atrata CBS 101060 TaxID=1346257 RepID=A0A9P4SGU1_9PEZI|nr:hypothetical protein M501DRAFT_993383 [Patellaria atrata CBS 101060]